MNIIGQHPVEWEIEYPPANKVAIFFTPSMRNASVEPQPVPHSFRRRNALGGWPVRCLNCLLKKYGSQ